MGVANILTSSLCVGIFRSQIYYCFSGERDIIGSCDNFAIDSISADYRNRAHTSTRTSAIATIATIPVQTRNFPLRVWQIS